MLRNMMLGLTRVVPVVSEELSAQRANNSRAGGGQSSGGVVVEAVGKVLTLLSVVFIIITFPISAWMCVKVIQEHERAIVFRLGRAIEGRAKGPGLVWFIPWLDAIQTVDLRTMFFNIWPQEVLTADAVPLKVDAVVFFWVVDLFMWVMRVVNGPQAMSLLAQTTLKTMIGAHTLEDVLTQKLAVAKRMEMALCLEFKSWGVQMERVELKALTLPVDLQRCMASEAVAFRRAGAIVSDHKHTHSHVFITPEDIKLYGSPGVPYMETSILIYIYSLTETNLKKYTKYTFRYTPV